jgi:hypothetical protein
MTEAAGPWAGLGSTDSRHILLQFARQVAEKDFRRRRRALTGRKPGTNIRATSLPAVRACRAA